jgi:RHS repeat-associated protein
LFEEHNSSFKTSYLYNGKELDRETNLSYYGARYLDMKTSLWLSTDPLAEKFPNFNPYAYCYQNPIRYIDPTGMEGEEVPVTGSEENQSKFINHLKEVTGGNYEIKNGLLLAVDGNYGNGTNADQLKTAIESKNSIPVNLVNNESSVFVDSYLNTDIDLGDIDPGNKEIKGLFYAHVFAERIAAGDRYSDSSKRLEDMKNYSFGGITLNASFSKFHNVGLNAEVDALSFHTGISRNELTDRKTSNIPAPYFPSASVGMQLDYGAYKFDINTTLQGRINAGRFDILSIIKK